MKAITIWQPWASLLACGAKKYETRSWATKYRGPIAIHAAARKCDMRDIPSEAHHIMVQAIRPITDKLARTIGYVPFEILPRGCIVATAELLGCHSIRSYIDETSEIILCTPAGEVLIGDTEAEYLFGDWTPGRFAWEFANMKMLDKPVPAKGGQGLWNWNDSESGR